MPLSIWSLGLALKLESRWCLTVAAPKTDNSVQAHYHRLHTDQGLLSVVLLPLLIPLLPFTFHKHNSIKCFWVFCGYGALWLTANPGICFCSNCSFRLNPWKCIIESQIWLTVSLCVSLRRAGIDDVETDVVEIEAKLDKVWTANLF